MIALQRVFEFSVKHPLLVILLTAVYAYFSASGIGGLVERSDYRSYVDADYPGLLELEKIEAIFNQNENIFIVVAPQQGSIFTPDNLRLIQHLTDDAWTLPYAARADSITNFQHTQADGDDLLVADLIPEDTPISRQLIAKARSVAASEPTLLGLLISEKQDVAAINVNFQFSEDINLSTQQNKVADAVDELLNSYREQHPDIRFMVAGSVVIDYLVGRYTKRVNEVQVPMMLGLMGILLFLFYRSFWGAACTAVVVILTGLTTMGLFGWLKMEVDGVSAVSPIVIMTLAVADSVHIIAGTLNSMRAGFTRKEAILVSLRSNFTPVFLTSVTTVLGVITFSFTDFPSLRKLGMVIAVGVTVALILSVTLLPALLSLAPLKARTIKQSSGLFVAMGEFVIRFHRKILFLSTIVCISLSAMISVIVINESFAIIFDEEVPEQQAVKFVSQHLSGFESMDVAIMAANPGDLNEPENLATIEAFVGWLKTHDFVRHVSTITDTYKRLNQNMHGDDPDWYRLPDTRDLAAQYLLLYEFSLPYGLDINNKVDAEKSGTRITLIMDGVTSSQVVHLKQEILHWFDNNAPSLKATPTGMMPLMADIGYLHMIPSMMQGGIIAVLMVSLVLLFALRSWRLGLLGMLANMVPIMMGYGLWGSAVGIVNFSVMSVAGICLGVVVDFAVHFLSKYRTGVQQGNSVEAGVRFAFEKVASPLWITTIVLTCGFWILATSNFNFVGFLGLLTGIIIILAFVFDLLVLPAILLTFKQFFGQVGHKGNG